MPLKGNRSFIPLTEEDEANALIIAIAPEMLDELRAALEAVETARDDHGDVAMKRYYGERAEKIRAVIRKAAGEPVLPSPADVAAEFRARGEEDPFKGQ